MITRGAEQVGGKDPSLTNQVSDHTWGLNMSTDVFSDTLYSFSSRVFKEWLPESKESKLIWVLRMWLTYYLVWLSEVGCMSNKCAVLGQIPGKQQVLSAPGAPRVRKLMFKSDYDLYIFFLPLMYLTGLHWRTLSFNLKISTHTLILSLLQLLSPLLELKTTLPVGMFAFRIAYLLPAFEVQEHFDDLGSP